MAGFGLQRRQAAQALPHNVLRLYELCTPANELREQSLLSARLNVRVELAMLTCDVTGDNLGIYSVGLATPPNTLAVAVQIPCIDDEHLQPDLIRQVGECP
jgi:hypothetical protein